MYYSIVQTHSSFAEILFLKNVYGKNLTVVFRSVFLIVVNYQGKEHHVRSMLHFCSAFIISNSKRIEISCFLYRTKNLYEKLTNIMKTAAYTLQKNIFLKQELYTKEKLAWPGL